MRRWNFSGISFIAFTTSKALVRLGGIVGLTVIVFIETGLLVGFFLPGDSLLVTAGLFAARGDLKVGSPACRAESGGDCRRHRRL